MASQNLLSAVLRRSSWGLHCSPTLLTLNEGRREKSDPDPREPFEAKGIDTADGVHLYEPMTASPAVRID